ncbi:hypothetical protein Tco_0010989 [Tanacetum coccineum]
MATLTDKAILSGADNRSPMLEKDMYDSWKSIMELYMMNRQHGRMILESVENGLQLRKMEQQISFSKELPPEVYALVSNHKVDKELWERIQLSMQGTYYETRNERGDTPSFVVGYITRTYTPGQVESNSTETKDCLFVTISKGRHLSITCALKPKRKRDDLWFKDKVLLVQAQVNGQILHEEELAFRRSWNCKDALAEINLDNKSVNDTLTAELERYKEQVKVLKEGQNVDLKSNNNISDSSAQSVEIDRLKQTLSEHLKEKESLMQTKAQQLEPKLYDGNVIKNTSAIVIPDSEETLMLAEESRSKMLLKQKDPMMLENKVNTTPVDFAVLNQLSQDFKT